MKEKCLLFKYCKLSRTWILIMGWFNVLNVGSVPFHILSLYLSRHIPFHTLRHPYLAYFLVLLFVIIFPHNQFHCAYSTNWHQQQQQQPNMWFDTVNIYMVLRILSFIPFFTFLLCFFLSFCLHSIHSKTRSSFMIYICWM